MLPNWTINEATNTLTEYKFIVTSSICVWSFGMLVWLFSNICISSGWQCWIDLWNIVGKILILLWLIMFYIWIWIKIWWIEEKKWIRPTIKIWISTIIIFIFIIVAHEYEIWIILFGLVFYIIFYIFYWKRWLQNITIVIVLLMGTLGVTVSMLILWYILLPIFGILFLYLSIRKKLTK